MFITNYYEEPSADTSDFGHQDENHKDYIFCWLQLNLSAQMMRTDDDHNIMQW